MSKSYFTVIVSAFLLLNILTIKPADAQRQTTVISGTIVRNTHRCEMDGKCFLEVQKMDGSVAEVNYGWEALDGDEITCYPDKTLSHLAWSLKPGQIVEIKGQLAKDGKTILLCNNQSHYLNVMSEK